MISKKNLEVQEKFINIFCGKVSEYEDNTLNKKYLWGNQLRC